MRTWNQAFTISLLAGAVVMSAAQSAEVPNRGPIPFDAFDADGSGAITAQEYQAARAARMEKRALQGRPMGNAPHAPSFTELDRNADGGIDRQELTAGQQAQMQKRSGPAGRGMGWTGAGGRNRPSFAEFDLDNDGLLGEDEFIEAHGRRISKRAEQGYPMRGLSKMRTFADFDRDGNGKVTPGEFAAAQARHQQERFR